MKIIQVTYSNKAYILIAKVLEKFGKTYSLFKSDREWIKFGTTIDNQKVLQVVLESTLVLTVLKEALEKKGHYIFPFPDVRLKRGSSKTYIQALKLDSDL